MINLFRFKWRNGRILVSNMPARNFRNFLPLFFFFFQQACVCDKYSRMMTDHSFNFIQHLNPVSNKMEWKVVFEDYDYNQEIATSCYGDMLHDEERVINDIF